MSGTDPALAAVQLAVRRHLEGVEPGTVVVACSGGADSLALLAAAVHTTRPSGRRVVGVVVDHGLQEGSAEHTARVVAQMAALGADETGSVRVSVEGGGQGAGQGPEAAAREARYAVLEEIAARVGAVHVLLGHTLDDQAETVLLGLARGSGGRSIAGMRRAFGVFGRPLLDLRRAQTEAACRAADTTWWDDPHNSDPRFTRSRVRHTVLPLLEAELGPGVAETLARTAAQLRPDMEALDAWAEAALAEHLVPADGGDGAERATAFDVAAVARLEPAVLARVLRLAAVRAGSPPADLAAVHVEALVQQVHNRTHLPREVQLPGRVTAVREGDRLRFERAVRG